MKRINKRSIFTVVLTLMLALSAGFYTCLNPTTAWFHAEDSDTAAYQVGTFDVDFDAYVHEDMTLTFDASTKLSEAQAQDDTLRNREFEYAVKFLYVTVRNNVVKDGEDVDYLDASVKLKFDSEAVGKGLRYYYFACSEPQDIDDDKTYYSSVSTDDNGTTAGNDLSSKIKAFCTSAGISSDADYIDSSKNTLMDFDVDDAAVTVPHNKQVTICIALWVDHDQYMNYINALDAKSLTGPMSFDTQMELFAKQTKQS